MNATQIAREVSKCRRWDGQQNGSGINELLVGSVDCRKYTPYISCIYTCICTVQVLCKRSFCLDKHLCTVPIACFGHVFRSRALLVGVPTICLWVCSSKLRYLLHILRACVCVCACVWYIIFFMYKVCPYMFGKCAALRRWPGEMIWDSIWIWCCFWMLFRLGNPNAISNRKPITEWKRIL